MVLSIRLCIHFGQVCLVLSAVLRIADMIELGRHSKALRCPLLRDDYLRSVFRGCF
jgi:hypothetical protein